MQFITNIDRNKYEKFVSKNKKSHFLQSTTWGDFIEKNNDRIPHYVGLVDDKNNLLAATLLLQKKLKFGYSYFYAPRGYVMDFDDFELLKTFTEELRKYAKSQKAIFLKIDPDIKLQDLDSDGNIIETNKSHYALVDKLKELGYRHMGYNKNFENSEPRYTFRLDLTQSLEDINEHFHPTTKKIIQEGNTHHLKILKNEEVSLDDFYLIIKEASKGKDILYYPKSYYTAFYEVLHRNNQSDLYEVTIDVKELKKEYKTIIKDLKEKIKTLNTKEDIKNQTKKQELVNQLTIKEKEWQEIKDIQEDRLALSAILTAKYGDKIWTVHGDNYPLLKELNANYLIYYEIIKDAKTEGYQIIDFFGTIGDIKEDNPNYETHIFKKGFGGEYTEFIGEFDLVINSFMYSIFQKLIPIYRNTKRKKLQRKKES